MEKYLAHVKEDDLCQWREHDLVEHLIGVAEQAKQFANEFQSGDWAYAAGLWHDLGKFQNAFQNYIKCASGYDPEAHIEEGKGRVDHSAAGAIYAIRKFNKCGRILAYLIAGHHTGLPDWFVNSELRGSALIERLDKEELLNRSLQESIPKEITELSMPKIEFKHSEKTISLWIRMLFSCLVDADFLDTEKFMDKNRHNIRGQYPSLNDLKKPFDLYMKKKSDVAPLTQVNLCRQEILQQCREKAILAPGAFTLTVPTGGGKTLSSMAFALEHALKHQKNRIIYVIPFTSIIEQTADIYREVFGEFGNCVIEHHSNLDSEKSSFRNRIAAENWDAPIIITTNVQFFESLFATRTSRTRKLHNIVNSVVIFDEAQQIPPDFLQPISDVLEELIEKYKVTCVFTTATPPDIKFKKLIKTEIISGLDAIVDKLKRVEIQLPNNIDEFEDWQSISNKLQNYSQVLCIVNTRSDCRELHSYMPKGTIHLSGLMCGEHRSEIIKEIKEKLLKGEQIRVISTQLVEAGVDIDFPVVYRALAGIDSIAQAAGRCNREGRLSSGQVHIFVSPKLSPPGFLRQCESITRNLIKQNITDLLEIQTFNQYFGDLYRISNTDKYGIEELLSKDARDLCFQFRTAASKFKIIDDTKILPVIVRYKDNIKLIKKLESEDFNKELLRKLQRYTISIPRQTHAKLLKSGKIKEIQDKGIFVQSIESLYHPEKGLLNDEDLLEPEDFIN